MLIRFGILALAVVLLVYLIMTSRQQGSVKKRLEAIEKEGDISVMLAQEIALETQKRRPTLGFVRVPGRVRASIASSGVKLKDEEFVLLWLLLVLVVAIFTLVFAKSFIICIIASALAAMAPPLLLSSAEHKRHQLFGEQLGDALLLISNALRAGFSFEQALESAARDMPDPLSSELSRVVKELKVGMSFEDSMGALAQRMENNDIKLLTSAVVVQRQVGGNLAEILDNISETIRERIRIKANIKTLTAQGRTSGLLIGALPIFLLIMCSIMNPGYMSMFTSTLIGYILLGVMAVLELIGALVIRNMVNIES